VGYQRIGNRGRSRYSVREATAYWAIRGNPAEISTVFGSPPVEGRAWVTSASVTGLANR